MHLFNLSKNQPRPRTALLLTASAALFLWITGCGKEPVSDTASSTTIPLQHTTNSPANDRKLPLTWVGEDRQTKKPCELVLHSEKEGANKDDYRATVSTSYEHNGSSVGQVELQFATILNATVLHWKQGVEELRVSLPATEDKLNNPSAFQLKWLHGDHTHANTCVKLKEKKNSP